MSKITIIALIAFLYLTVWMAYECVECFFGKRIRGKLKEWRDNRAAFKLYEEQQRLNKIKAGKRLEVVEVEVEDMGLSSAVFYDKSGEVTTFTTELIIIKN